MRTHLVAVSSLALSLSLSACGGAGGERPAPLPAPPSTPATPPPPPAPAPAPAPTPTPTPAPAPPTEYANSAAAAGARAQYAHDRGYTGKGVTIAVIDSGIDIDNAEFAGRISADSRSFETRYATCGTCAPETATFDLNDVQGHGTAVASIAAAARNDNGIQGVAHDSTILALKVAAVDLDRYTPGAPLREAGVNSNAIAPAMRYAMEHGAFVVNLSINGYASDQMAADLRGAMDAIRQHNGLMVQSVSNNAGDSFAGTMTETMVGADFANKEWFLYGLRLDQNLNPIPGNGTPGALADRTLSVVAQGVAVTNLDGGTTIMGGNSFAAPAIAGAAALLKQYWPQLGGREISQILLSTATDLGAPGADQVYGAGLLNIEAAFKADAPKIGASTATMSAVSESSLVVSPAFGGAGGSATFSAAAGKAVVLDRWGRDYQLNVGALVGSMRSAGISIAGLAQARPLALYNAQRGPAALAPEQHATGYASPLPPAQFSLRLSPALAVSGEINTDIDAGQTITGSLLRSSGLATRGSVFSLHHGDAQVDIGVARTEMAGATASTRRFSMTLPNGLIAGFTSSREHGAALGMRGGGAFKIEGARSAFVTLGWTGNIGGFSLAGEAIAGRTRVSTRNALIEFSKPVLSTGFRFRAERNLFGGDAVFGIASPLKVERAQLRYTAPAAYDPETGRFINRTSLINLTPEAREINFEAGWRRVFGRSYLSLNGAYGLNTGNVAGQTSAAAWIRFGTAF